MWRYTVDLIFVAAVVLGSLALFAAVFFLYKYFVNQRIKGKFIKLNLPRISTLIVVFAVFVTGTLGGYFINMGVTNNRNSLYAQIGLSRAENAQYVPEFDKLAPSITPLSVSISELSETGVSAGNYESRDYAGLGNYAKLNDMNLDISVENYNQFVEMIGDIDNPYDRSFTILDAKAEMEKVFQSVNVFDRWVKLKNGELAGHGAYYLSYNEKDRHLTVMRKSSFQPWVWDQSKNQALWNGSYPEFYLIPGQKGYVANFNPISSDIIYKIDYYYENGIEVVECEIFDVLHYSNKDYIERYQYVKNVKDTSFTKCVVTPRAYAGSYDGHGLADIYSDNPYGTERQFMRMDYKDSENMQFIIINQVFTSAYNSMPDVTTMNMFSRTDDELLLYNTMFSSDLSYYKNAYDLNNPSGVFLYTGYDDIFKMYAGHNGLRITSHAETEQFNKDYKPLYGSLIKDAVNEIVYKKGNGIAAYISTYDLYEKTTVFGDITLTEGFNSAFGKIKESLDRLAEESGAVKNNFSLPAQYDRNDCVFENSIQAYLNVIAKKIVDGSYFTKRYSSLLKKAGKYILI